MRRMISSDNFLDQSLIRTISQAFKLAGFPRYRKPGASTYSRISTLTPSFTGPSAILSSWKVTSSLIYSSPQPAQTSAGIFLITTVAPPLWEVNVALPGRVSPSLQFPHFMSSSSFQNHAPARILLQPPYTPIPSLPPSDPTHPTAFYPPLKEP